MSFYQDCWFLILCNCEYCGHDTQLYGSYKTRELAENDYPKGSIAGMSCCKRTILKLTLAKECVEPQDNTPPSYGDAQK